MNIIRTIIVFIYLIPVFFISLIQLAIGYFYTKIDPLKSELWQLKIVKFYLKSIYLLGGIRPEYRGLENLPEAGTGVLYVSNHRSIFDIILTYCVQPGPVGYISKKEFEHVPLLAWWMKRISCLFLDRDNIKDGLKMVLTAIDKVKNGTSMTIYPEGGRFCGESELDMLPFHEGSFKIATKSKAKVIPVAVHDTSRLFEEHRPIIYKGKPVIWFGEPVDLETLPEEDKKHPGRYMHGVILDMLKQLNSSEQGL